MEREQLFQKFKMAIDNEFEAHQFYKEIADKSESPELRLIFERLAKEEWEHRETILKRYRILRELAE
jgi:rubrerythrin